MGHPATATRTLPALSAFLVSLGVLVMEISLTRVLSFSLWYHFTYVVIAVGLLGYGASGAALASSRRLGEMEPARLVRGACLLGTLAIALALLAIAVLPFQPFYLGSDPTQSLLMVLYLLAIGIPFLMAGLVISVVLRSYPERTTVIYFADLAGGGIGCALAIPAIWGLGAPGAIALSAAVMAAAGIFFSPVRRLRAGVAGVVGVAAVAAVAFGAEFKPSGDKFFAAALRQGAELLYSRWSPIFRVDVYQSPLQGSRLGTSKVWDGKLPPVRFIAHDGTAEAAMYQYTGKPEELEFIDWNIVSAPYQALERPSVLIIGLGGGFDVLAAIRADARSITGVEIDPVTVDIVRDHSGDFAGHILDRPEVETVISEGRSFLRQNPDRYDLIQLTGVDTLAALSSGAYVLAESYLYTVESMKDYLSRLTEDGIVSFMLTDFSWKGKRGTRFTLRHVANFIEAANELGYENPGAHVAVIAGPGDVTEVEIMFRRTPFRPEQIANLRRYAEERQFSIWALPGTLNGSPIEFLLYGSPQNRENFFENYPLEVRATHDDDPFFFHFFRWGDLLGITARDIDRGHTGATGQVILLALLAFAVGASGALILVPLLISKRLALGAPGSMRFAIYFGAIGLGFMLLEISLIQRFILFLGHPTYSIATILAALLISTGFGSFFSGRIPVAPRRLLAPTLVGVVLLTIGWLLWLPDIFNALLGTSLLVRAAVTVLLLTPLGLLLGVFFPSGLRIVSPRNADFVPWAWGVNGGASVVGSILAIVLGITYGFPGVSALGLGIYAAGVIAMLSVRPLAATGNH